MMEETTNKSPESSSETSKERTFKSGWIVALSASAVSILTLLVFIYQTHIMQKQQHASVWPYIQWGFTQSSDEGFYLSVENKGVGPAIIKSTTLKYDGVRIDDVREFLKKILPNADTLPVMYSSVNGQVFAAGEAIRLFHVRNGIVGQHLNFSDLYKRIEFEICFCSIYGDCWTSTGTEVVESVCK